MPHLKPTYALTVGRLNSTTDDPVGGPRSLVVERDMDVPADALRLTLLDRSGIDLGDEVTLDLGHDGQEERVFTGAVASLRPAIAGVEVWALGKMNALLNLHTSTVYENQSIGGIARDLIGQAGLSAGTVDEGPTLPRYTVDCCLSAYAHLRALAERLGYELYGDRQGQVLFHGLGPAAGLDALGGLGGAVGVGLAGGERYLYGQHLLDAASERQPLAWGTVRVGGESPMSRQGDTTAHWLTVKDTDYQGSAGDGQPTLLVLDPAARTKDLADRFAAGRLAAAARVAHEVWVRVLGRVSIVR